MDIVEKLLARHDKATAIEIAQQAVSNPRRLQDFDELCIIG
ncbi:MAG: hypothetical protein R2784_06160 [Saprospiraceae bacterium]